jgi:hypothetical protein
MYYIGLDVHKRIISYCVKDSGGTIHAEDTIPATRFDLDENPAAAECGDGSHRFYEKEKQKGPICVCVFLFLSGSAATHSIHSL